MQLEVVQHRVTDLEEALSITRKKKRKRKLLPLQPVDGNDGGGAVLWSPSRIERAKQELQAKEDLERAAKKQKLLRRSFNTRRRLFKQRKRRISVLSKIRRRY